MTARAVLPAILALGVILTACQPPAQQAAALSDEDIAAIRDMTDRLVPERLLAKDWAGFAAAFTEDAVRMPPNQPLHVGRAAIEAWSATNWGPITTTELIQTAEEIDGRGDLAYARGSYSATVVVPGVPEPISDAGKFLVILRKQPDGSWLASTAIFNSDAPPSTM